MIRKFFVSFFAIVFLSSPSFGGRLLLSEEEIYRMLSGTSVKESTDADESSEEDDSSVNFVEECLTEGLEGEDVFKVTEAVGSLYSDSEFDRVARVVKQKGVVACAYALIIRDNEMDVGTRLGILRAFHAIPEELRSNIVTIILSLSPHTRLGFPIVDMIQVFGRLPNQEVREKLAVGLPDLFEGREYWAGLSSFILKLGGLYNMNSLTYVMERATDLFPPHMSWFDCGRFAGLLGDIRYERTLKSIVDSLILIQPYLKEKTCERLVKPLKELDGLEERRCVVKGILAVLSTDCPISVDNCIRLIDSVGEVDTDDMRTMILDEAKGLFEYLGWIQDGEWKKDNVTEKTRDRSGVIRALVLCSDQRKKEESIARAKDLYEKMREAKMYFSDVLFALSKDDGTKYQRADVLLTRNLGSMQSVKDVFCLLHPQHAGFVDRYILSNDACVDVPPQ